MNHLHHFPHSHGHLLSFSILAVTMALIAANTAVAQFNGIENNQSPQNFQPTENFHPPQNFVDQPVAPIPNIVGPNMGPNNQPTNDKPVFVQPNDFDAQKNFGNQPNFVDQPKFDGQQFDSKKFENKDFENKDFKDFGDQKFVPPVNNNQVKEFGNNFEENKNKFSNDQFNNHQGNFDPKNANNFDPSNPNNMGKNQEGPMMNGEDQSEEQKEHFDKQMLKNAQQQIKHVEQELRQFDKKAQAVTKLGLTVPAEFSTALAKVKTIIAGVKSAKTADDLEATGWEDLRGEISTLYESQGLLEQLSQWPKILKMTDKQIAREKKNLIRYKALVDKLLKKDIDVSSLYAELETVVNSLQSSREEAVAKVVAGDVEEAFDILEDKFYDWFEAIRDKQGIMQTMSNVGRFPIEFKKAQKQMNKVVSDLKKRKIDTAELEELQVTFKQRGQIVHGLIKARPIDMDAIQDALEDLFDSKQDFMNKMQALDGESSEKPSADYSF